MVEIFIDLHSDWDIMAQLLSEPLYYEKYHSSDDDHEFHTILRGSLNDLGIYLKRLEPSELKHFYNEKNLALCYVMFGMAALEYILQLPETNDSLKALKSFAGWLASKGHIEGVNRLLSIDAISDEAARYCLVPAATHGQTALVQALLQRDEIIDDADYDDNEALYQASIYGHAKVVISLLENPYVRAIADSNDNLALTQAITGGHADTVRLLLEVDNVRAGAITDAKELLERAYRFGHILVLEQLLNVFEIRVQASTDGDHTFSWAAREGHLSLINLMLSVNQGAFAAKNHNYALRCAAAEGRLAIVQRLFKVPIVRAQAACIDNNALLCSALNGHLDVANFLLEQHEIRTCAVPFDLEALSSVSLDVIEKTKTIVKSGFIRALWLGLQQADALRDVNSLSELEATAQAHLNEHQPWMSANNFFNEHELIASLLKQVLALRLYGYMNHIEVQPQNINQRIIEQSFRLDLTVDLNKLIALPKNLKHFEDHPDISLAATRCLKVWTQDQALKRRPAKPGVQKRKIEAARSISPRSKKDKKPLA